MKVAVSGIGGVAKYLLDELPKQGHEVVAVTRSRKPYLGPVEQRLTDYSVEDLKRHINDCDAVVSCITAHSPEFTSVQLAILQACKETSKCKRFLPSAWAGNYEEVPDQPLFAGPGLETINNTLRAQNEVRWTIFCQGWMSDYVLPSHQRYFDDLGDRLVQNYERMIFTLYGNGSQKVDFTSGRDAAQAVCVLLHHDANDWEDFTCVSGQRMTWHELWDLIKAQSPEYQLKKKSLAQSIKQLIANESEAAVAAAMYEIMGHSEALAFPEGKIERHRQKYFQSLKFRTVAELLEDARENPGIVV